MLDIHFKKRVVGKSRAAIRIVSRRVLVSSQMRLYRNTGKLSWLGVRRRLPEAQQQIA